MSSTTSIRALVMAATIVASLAVGAVAQAADPKAPKPIQGRFDVGGHKLSLQCTGSGSPAIVYLHGYIWNGQGGGSSAGLLPLLLEKKHRICVYDRPNPGESDPVAGPVTARQTVTDLHTLLRVAKVKPPYVLLGASFGGLLAHIYAATYPREVKGMVLLDAGFPTELPLEELFPPDERLTHDQWNEGAEKIDELDTYELAYKLLPKQAKIPVTYLLALPYSWLGLNGPPAYNEAAPKALAEYMAGFAPGKIKRVKSDHYMEQAIPERVGREVELIFKRIRKG